MMTLLERMAFSPKKRLTLILMIIIMMGVMIVLPIKGYREDPKLFLLVISSHQTIISHLLSLLIVFFSTWMAIDLEHPFLGALTAYFGFWPIYLLRLAFIIQWIIILYTPLFLIQHGVIYLITASTPSLVIVYDAVHDIMDSLFIVILALPLTRSKHPTIAFILPLIYLIHQTVMPIYHSIMIYALCPLYQPMIHHYHLAILYKLCYIGLGFILISHFLQRKPSF